MDLSLENHHPNVEKLAEENRRLRQRIADLESQLGNPPSGEDLRRNQGTFYNLIQNNPFGVYLVDADFRLRQVSLGAQKVFANVRPLLGRDFADVLRTIWPEPFASEATARFRHTLDTGEPYSAPSTVERRNDIQDVEAYDWRIERVVLPEGRHGVVCYFYDLSERQRWEAALRDSEQKYRSLFDNMSEGFAVGEVVCRPDGTAYDFCFVEMNGAFERQSGLTRAILNRPAREALPNLEQYWIDTYCQVALTGEPVHFDAPNADTRRHYDVFCYSPAKGRFAIVFTDITARKRAEDALAEAFRAAEEAKAIAEAASKAKDQFIAVLSHELRTPLTPAVAAMALLRTDSRLPSDVRDDLEMVSRNLDLEVRLIADLLDVSRIISGKLHLEKHTIDAADAIREAGRIVANDLATRSQTLTIETVGTPYLLHGDAARLQQVFWNLLRNSIKFSPEGSTITIHASVEAAEHCPLAKDDCPEGVENCPLAGTNPQQAGRTCGGILVVNVTDHGSGIAPEMLPRLFTAFEQEDKARSFGGLGLGLSICRAVVEMHGGTISAHSDGPGRGATLTVRLPVARCPLSPPVSHRQAIAPSEQHLPGHAPSHPMKILLVEDNDDTARLLRRLLLTAGHRVTTAASVAAALASVQMQRPDLIISDLGLPDGSGIDLLHELTAQGLNAPAIALSGYGTPADIEQSRAAGFVEHLIKPLNGVAALWAAIARASTPANALR